MRSAWAAKPAIESFFVAGDDRDVRGRVQRRSRGQLRLPSRKATPKFTRRVLCERCPLFRDGNVPAGFEQRRVLQDALALLPDDVQTVSLRSDSAGYQTELLKYCAEGKN